MTVKNTEIETTIINPLLHEFFRVPVFYTDEFIETSVYDFAYSSANGGFLPYLFTGYFSDSEGFGKWFFSNARRHEEMRAAIEQDIGKKDYAYGQIWFDQKAQNEAGELLFQKLILQSDISEREREREQ